MAYVLFLLAAVQIRMLDSNIALFSSRKEMKWENVKTILFLIKFEYAYCLSCEVSLDPLNSLIFV